MVQIKLILFERPLPTFFSNAHGIVFVFDLTRPDTLKNLPELVKHTLTHSDTSPAIILIGNKKDLDLQRRVGKAEIVEIINNLKEIDDNIQYIETSAKTGQNVNLMFETLSRKMIETLMAKLPRTPENTEKPLTFQVMVVGDQGVGCTSLIQRYTVGRFSESYEKAIEAEFHMKTLELEEPGEGYPIKMPFAQREVFKAEKKLDRDLFIEEEDKESLPPEPTGLAEAIKKRKQVTRSTAPPSKSPPPAPGGPAAAPSPPLSAPPAPPPSTKDDKSGSITPLQSEMVSEPLLRKKTMKESQPILHEKEVTPDALITRETAVSYYDRMNPSQNFPLRVMISKKLKELESMKEITHVKGKLEVEREEKELPIVRVVPIFPGCIVTPQESSVNIEEDQTVFFYLTPLVLGHIDGKVEFWYHGHKIAVSDTPTTVKKQTVAKICAAAGMVMGVIPSILDFFGFDLNGTIKTAFEQKRPALASLVNSLGGLLILEIIILILFILLGGYFYLLARPHEVEQPQTLSYI
ncbi:MAG: hypothetical protein ACFFCW_03380 [Candidatus Hodarchaeota archaeon]